MAKVGDIVTIDGVEYVAVKGRCCECDFFSLPSMADCTDVQKKGKFDCNYVIYKTVVTNPTSLPETKDSKE